MPYVLRIPNSWESRNYRKSLVELKKVTKSQNVHVTPSAEIPERIAVSPSGQNLVGRLVAAKVLEKECERNKQRALLQRIIVPRTASKRGKDRPKERTNDILLVLCEEWSHCRRTGIGFFDRVWRCGRGPNNSSRSAVQAILQQRFGKLAESLDFSKKLWWQTYRNLWIEFKNWSLSPENVVGDISPALFVSTRKFHRLDKQNSSAVRFKKSKVSSEEEWAFVKECLFVANNVTFGKAKPGN